MPVASADDRLPVAAVGLIWLAAAAAMALLYWPRLDESFASADNLMRLVQVRAWLDGAPWFDPHEPRLTVWQLVDGAYREVADVTGEEPYTSTLPYSLTVVPARLVG